MTVADNGKPIPAWVSGQLSPADKIEVHRSGLRHMAVSVFVTDGDEILIQRRALGKYHTPGLWANTCCTHPHWDEDPRDCAIRRLRQELGIIGVDPSFCGQIEYRADVGNGMIEHEVVDVFRANLHAKVKLAPDPQEVMETCWITLADLARDVSQKPDRFTPWLRIYLAEHRRMIFGKKALD